MNFRSSIVDDNFESWLFENVCLWVNPTRNWITNVKFGLHYELLTLKWNMNGIKSDGLIFTWRLIQLIQWDSVARQSNSIDFGAENSWNVSENNENDSMDPINPIHD